MQEETIKIFDVNTDAIATNRGFYYQYLFVLKKWIQNFINEKDIETFTEVDDDIKEVGEELIFTQIKCYTSSFSFNSPEIKKSIFNFFMLYLKHKNMEIQVKFHFLTNSKISQREKLLSKWTKDSQLKDSSLRSACSKKIKEILIKEVNVKKNSKLQRNINESDKNKIKKATKDIKSFIGKSNILPFIKSILWEFNNVSPNESIKIIQDEIYSLLKHPKFKNKPTSFLFSLLLSEIYKASKNENKNDRCLNKQTIINLIKHTDKELSKHIDDRLIKLFRIDVEVLQYEVKQIKKEQEKQGLDIEYLKNNQIASKKNLLPKNLNLLPDFYSINIYGWENFLNQVNLILKEKRMLSIYAEGGMGKTSFGKKYLKTFTDYNHLIWINIEQSINYSFVSDDLLEKNLNIGFSKSNDVNQRFSYLLNELNKIKGKNLLIVDIQEAEDEVASLKVLSSISSWEKLILTRSHLKTLQTLKLPKISFNVAKKIYLSSSNIEDVEDSLLKDFFEYIDYNVLVIELTAKTIKNSVDLTLATFYSYLKSQRLDDDKLKIDIDIDGEVNSIKIFNFLIQKFAFKNLKDDEKGYLKFLSLLPSNNVVVEDLILINGLEFYDKNKITISNIINSLDKKGLVGYSSDRKSINIHKVIQEIIIYDQRQELNGFISNMFFFNDLTRRIMEGYNSPKKSFKYLRYAESILNKIKEEYRSSVYQPLLLLENELLFSKRFYITMEKEFHRLINLVERAENNLGLKDNNLAVMYNNLGLSYSDREENRNALHYFNKALNIFKNKEKEFVEQIIITSNNVSSLHLKNEDLISAVAVFKEVQEIRKKYSLYDDQQLGIEYGILSKSYKIAGDYKKAIKLTKEGIKLHKSLSSSKRNDFYLSSYYSELSDLYLLRKNIDEAIKNQELGIKILEEMNLQSSEYIFSMYQVALKLYQFRGYNKKEKQMANKIKSFKNYQS